MPEKGYTSRLVGKKMQTRKSLSADLLPHLRMRCPVSRGACRAQLPWQLELLNVNSRQQHVIQTIASKLNNLVTFPAGTNDTEADRRGANGGRIAGEVRTFWHIPGDHRQAAP
ncbi:unnamed protein product [Polarella glacialis]|uniref:Uncharacterized protein n=1 Tax=Polarella glacialis TaxID=89957 RepID=A0A813FAQ6_POLGL|nr:unnamed protein product [Polarella glacialis]